MRYKKSPISFNQDTVLHLLNILSTNKNHLKQFMDEIFENYNSVISVDFNIINHLLPYIDDVNVAFKKYQDNVYLDPKKLSLSMLKNLINNADAFNNDKKLFNSYIIEILNNISTISQDINARNIRSIAKEITHICLLPMDKRQKYSFDDTESIISVFQSQIETKQQQQQVDNGYINYLLDNASNMTDIDDIRERYGDSFDCHNLYHMVYRVINGLKLSNELNTGFVSFVFTKNKELIKTMGFNDVRISLKLLSILNKNIINSNMGQFISMIESLQQRMIDLFLSNQQLLSTTNNKSKFGHKCIVYNIDEIIGIISAFSKHRMYNEQLMNLLAEQCVVNIFKNNPRHSSSITYFDIDTQTRASEKNIHTLFPMYTTILRHMRYLNYHQNKVYAMIASSLQKRPDLIKIEELREWCLTFGAMNHTSNSIWLSIQSVILHHYPTSNDIMNNMSMDCLIDFVWSMSVLDLIPNYWLMPDLITMVNDTNNREIMENLSFIHRTRLWEIFQALYASPTHNHSLNLVDDNI